MLGKRCELKMKLGRLKIAQFSCAGLLHDHKKHRANYCKALHLSLHLKYISLSYQNITAHACAHIRES